MNIRRSICILGSLAFLFGCSSNGDSNGNKRQTSASTTGSVALATVAAGQKIYVPSSEVGPGGERYLDVLSPDVTDNGALARVGQVNLGVTSDGDGDGVNDGAIAVGADKDVVVAVGGQIRTIWIVDAKSDTVTGTLDLPDTYFRFNVSHLVTYATGVSVDAVRRTAYVAVWNGFAVIDLATKTIKQNILAAPPENFGYDPVHQWLVAPFYSCGSNESGGGAPLSPPCDLYKGPGDVLMPSGLSVVDLATGRTFAYHDDASTDPASPPEAPLGFQVDATAVDPVLRLAIAADDASPLITAIDLGAASFDVGNNTVSAPHAKITLDGIFPIIALEPSLHLVVGAREEDNTMLFFDAAKAKTIAQTGTGTVTVIYPHLPTLPDGSAWQPRYDPHGINTGIVNGRPFAFLADIGQQWILKIDLTTVKAILEGGPQSFDTAVTYVRSTPP